MCGIFAMLNPPGKSLDLPACRDATRLLSHRGPDASGEWISQSNDVYLGHRRLSIIDLSDAGAQPMISETGNVLIYNGEIYNFRALRKELESRGCRFKSSCDTEVLLQALEVWGADCLEKLEGMFAFVYWRPASEEALVVRDFFGIKPLYYWLPPGGGLAVSSEIKSFYSHPDFEPEFNSAALPEYLRFRSLCGQETLLREVKPVQPGQFLKYKRAAGRLLQTKYWSPESTCGGDGPVTDSQNYCGEFLSVFKNTVARHLIADVPIGTQFSGGIDSSLISAVAVKDLKTPLTGFHCRVNDADFDEMPFAQDIGRLLGMDLRVRDLSPEMFFSDLLERLTWHHDEPLTHPNAVGIYLISEAAGNEVKALLSGEAADEFFAGYARYPLLLIQNKLRKIPALLQGLEWLSESLPFVKGRNSVLGTLLAQSRHKSPEDQIVSGNNFMEDATLLNLLRDSGAIQKSVHTRWGFLSENHALDILTRCQLFDIRTYLPPLLVRQDKMSMAASIENRVPFATPQVLAIAMRLPPARRATLVGRKLFLKSCSRKYIPEKYVKRAKWGFGIPLRVWLSRPEGGERLRSLTAAESPLRYVVDIKTVRESVDRFGRDKGHANALWTLLSLKVWMDIFGKSKPSFLAGRST
jgi:asparagine synthase (glutamine-hydrolysing)